MILLRRLVCLRHKRNLDRTLAAGHVVRLGLRVRARRGERQASLAYIITLLLLLLLTRARVCVCVCGSAIVACQY